MRLDVYLCQSGRARSRTLAARLIADGFVQVNGCTVKKASHPVEEGDSITLSESSLTRYVSRGGLKLEHALDTFCIEVRAKCVFDFGASTGGFCDCLLRRGAARVFAVDVGKSQLAESIRQDARVVCMEETDARSLAASPLGACDLGVMDVSFISQALLYEACAKNLKAGGDLVTLYKPQFEVGREHIGKGGIVRDVCARERTLETLIRQASRSGLRLVGKSPSPIPGGDGNYEELLHFVRCEDV